MIRSLFRRFLAVIFPKSCLICNKIIDGGSFCVEDWNKLYFLQKPACDICFHPFEFEVEDQIICGKCSKEKPEYFKALSVLNYDENSKILVTKFKYFDQTYLAKYFANLMFKQAMEILQEIDFIAPVPLHKFRIIRRKYNQAALLAKHFAELSGKKLISDLLVRTENNAQQTTLNQKTRRRNVAGIFKTKKKYLKQIKDKNILLIDDVITTGATCESCCKELKRSGAKRIYVLTLAKTVLS
ncbi:MAG: utilization protein GntX [Rickettsiaceae bacterium]|nr:utilization protein GntX [Rickettsiaceae bacterium]